MERRLCGRLLLGCLVLISLALFTAAPAAAQDQSERIDQLEKLIASQQEQLNALQAQLNQLLAQREEEAPVAPDRVTSSSDTVGLSIYGQINRGVLYVNDGTNQEFLNVDNDHSSTRIGLVGEAKLREGRCQSKLA